MKKNLFIIISTVSIVLFLLCITCSNDETDIKLGQGYYYIPFKEVTFDVTGFGGNGIFVYKDHCRVPIVYPEIISYKYDSTFLWLTPVDIVG